MATTRIGKNGLTEGVINEIKAQLKRSSQLTIELSKGAQPTGDASSRQLRNQLAQEIAEKTNSQVKRVVGFKIHLTRRKSKSF